MQENQSNQGQVQLREVETFSRPIERNKYVRADNSKTLAKSSPRRFDSLNLPPQKFELSLSDVEKLFGNIYSIDVSTRDRIISKLEEFENQMILIENLTGIKLELDFDLEPCYMALIIEDAYLDYIKGVNQIMEQAEMPIEFSRDKITATGDSRMDSQDCVIALYDFFIQKRTWPKKYAELFEALCYHISEWSMVQLMNDRCLEGVELLKERIDQHKEEYEEMEFETEEDRQEYLDDNLMPLTMGGTVFHDSLHFDQFDEALASAEACEEFKKQKYREFMNSGQKYSLEELTKAFNNMKPRDGRFKPLKEIGKKFCALMAEPKPKYSFFKEGYPANYSSPIGFISWIWDFDLRPFNLGWEISYGEDRWTYDIGQMCSDEFIQLDWENGEIPSLKCEFPLSTDSYVSSGFDYEFMCNEVDSVKDLVDMICDKQATKFFDLWFELAEVFNTITDLKKWK